jgi:hypothetical protein
MVTNLCEEHSRLAFGDAARAGMTIMVRTYFSDRSGSAKVHFLVA